MVCWTPSVMLWLWTLLTLRKYFFFVYREVGSVSKGSLFWDVWSLDLQMPVWWSCNVSSAYAFIFALTMSLLWEQQTDFNLDLLTCCDTFAFGVDSSEGSLSTGLSIDSSTGSSKDGLSIDLSKASSSKDGLSNDGSIIGSSNRPTGSSKDCLPNQNKYLSWANTVHHNRNTKIPTQWAVFTVIEP